MRFVLYRIECFDHTAPTVRARISVQLLRIEASDSQSGVTEITAGGNKTTTTPATAPSTPPASQETPTPSITTPVSTSKDTGNTTTKPLTPDGQGTVVDEATNEAAKSFLPSLHG